MIILDLLFEGVIIGSFREKNGLSISVEALLLFFVFGVPQIDAGSCTSDELGTGWADQMLSDFGGAGILKFSQSLH